MNVIAIVVALGVEQWRTFRWRGALQQAFIRYARWLEHRFNGGSAQHGAIATTLALAPPVVVAACGYWALAQLHSLLGLAWNVLILYLLVGFRHFSHAFSAIVDALKAGDAIAARRRLAAWRGGDAEPAAARRDDELARRADRDAAAQDVEHRAQAKRQAIAREQQQRHERARERREDDPGQEHREHRRATA